MIRIILAEDHNIVRNGIRSLLEQNTDFLIAGEADNGQHALDLMANGVEADIILLDMNMPGINGAELIEKLKETSPQIKVIVLTMNDHEKYILQAFQVGAEGYLLKNVSPDELGFAIRHIYSGGRYICSELSLRLLDRRIGQSDLSLKDIDLSKRELEILGFIAEGLTNTEIAERLFTSKRTVEGHRQNLLEKTGCRNTAALIKFSILKGLINT